MPPCLDCHRASPHRRLPACRLDLPASPACCVLPGFRFGHHSPDYGSGLRFCLPGCTCTLHLPAWVPACHLRSLPPHWIRCLLFCTVLGCRLHYTSPDFLTRFCHQVLMILLYLVAWVHACTCLQFCGSGSHLPALLLARFAQPPALRLRVGFYYLLTVCAPRL